MVGGAWWVLGGELFDYIIEKVGWWCVVCGGWCVVGVGW